MKVVGYPANRASPPVDVIPGGRPVARSRRRRRKEPPAAEEEVPQGLAASFWFDSGREGRPYSATVRFSGRRVGATGRLGKGDTFTQDEVIESVVPGTGPVSVTARIYDINAGEWTVTAEMMPSARGPAAPRSLRLGPGGSQRLNPVDWSWRRWSISVGTPRPVKTRWAPLTNFEWMPAVVPGSWSALVLAGVLVGLALQVLLVRRVGVDALGVLEVSLVASIAGLGGAKAWYVALNLRSWPEALRIGLCIQGFIVAAILVGLGGALLLHLPVGPLLDATAPGLFFGVGIGRVGCFLTGCCAGRPSASRWAVWCSDRRVGARRIPTQLLESLAGLAIAVPSLWFLLSRRPAVSGAVFLAAVAAYTLARQGLLRLRGEGRRSALGSPLTAAAAVIVLTAAVSAAFLGVPRPPL
ncbi:MAG: prolipoprotein diacylglyceryl transferase [Candidatus Dormibacteria bacterium]